MNRGRGGWDLPFGNRRVRRSCTVGHAQHTTFTTTSVTTPALEVQKVTIARAAVLDIKFLMARSTEFEIISSLTRPGASIEAAIQDILLLTSEAALAKSDTTDNHNNPLSIHLNDVWSSLVEKVVATTVPAQQGALVEFLRVLRRQEVNDPATGEQISYALVPDYNVPVWTGLPLFGISVRDEWNFGMSNLPY
jgi:hypothetical protein